ncbi:nickel insertion protein [Sporosarcina pasteurii]|uniref:Protein of uncharacterized function DUF111 n=1 Tax=Sporosarcina pasteurii TaxID=1474 RepID=A0A380BDN4_SPOPA|nr:nickel insertion protein [Sporosarcina pasteurii]MDS9472479.1 pyridinium-3,5-bisthiocarboxylic acid mononucleotide nickel chelatase [Sporosarcina pasteurii]QBQ06035.1 DUF111 family protein [Sporosarcina pasteurii]SUI99644.1 Protein of uncharacterised function DUF111 [Sporosarcina pasteurii]
MSVIHPPNHAHIDDAMFKVEVNLDDISGEILGYVMDLLIDAGANDVYYTPIYMKKNRPAILLQLLCSKSKLNKMKEILFQETTTLGVRYYPLTVHRMERSFRKVSTKWGEVTVKEGILDGQVIKSSPEFEECKEIAEANHVPLKHVYEEVWKKLSE